MLAEDLVVIDQVFEFAIDLLEMPAIQVDGFVDEPAEERIFHQPASVLLLHKDIVDLPSSGAQILEFLLVLAAAWREPGRETPGEIGKQLCVDAIGFGESAARFGEKRCRRQQRRDRLSGVCASRLKAMPHA